jgi:hypothetical protein
MTPADCCIGCNTTLAQVGGQRIVYTYTISVSISDDKVEVNGLPCPLRARARRQLRAGRRPWLCQRCSNVGLCPGCGAVYPRAPGAECCTTTARLVTFPPSLAWAFAAPGARDEPLGSISA